MGAGPCFSQASGSSAAPADLVTCQSDPYLKTEAPAFDFYFVCASKIREWTEQEGPLLRQQDLLAKPGWLVKKTLSFHGLLSGIYAREFVAVSHRWIDPEHPDSKCSKLQALREVLTAMPDANYVWMDFPCLPQGRKTDEEAALFRASLDVVNYLYLGLHVIVLFDKQYVGRFWTCYECWLAMQRAGPSGIKPSVSGARFTMICLGSAKTSADQHKMALLNDWCSKSPEEAAAILREDDIIVTNQSDKDTQLEKLSTLSTDVCNIFKDAEAFLAAREESVLQEQKRLSEELESIKAARSALRSRDVIFVVSLKKGPEGRALHVDIKGMVIEQVRAGPITEWNARNPDKAVRAGDKIVKVNGSRGSTDELLELIKACNSKGDPLSLSFQRRG